MLREVHVIAALSDVSRGSRCDGSPHMIQINAAARLPPKMAHGIKTAFHHRSGCDRDDSSQRGCTRLRPVFNLGNTMNAGVRQG